MMNIGTNILMMYSEYLIRKILYMSIHSINIIIDKNKLARNYNK